MQRINHDKKRELSFTILVSLKIHKLPTSTRRITLMWQIKLLLPSLGSITKPNFSGHKNESFTMDNDDDDDK
jgi:hypothetical protein